VSANIVAAEDYKIQAKKQPKIRVLLRVVHIKHCTLNFKV